MPGYSKILDHINKFQRDDVLLMNYRPSLVHVIHDVCSGEGEIIVGVEKFCPSAHHTVTGIVTICTLLSCVIAIT
jgi:hypothetical protein